MPDNCDLVDQFSKAQTNGELLQWGLDLADRHAAERVRQQREARERAESDRDKLASDLAETAEWYRRMERAEGALREREEQIAKAVAAWEKVEIWPDGSTRFLKEFQLALAALKSSQEEGKL